MLPKGIRRGDGGRGGEADRNMKSDLPQEPTVIQSLCNRRLSKQQTIKRSQSRRKPNGNKLSFHIWWSLFFSCMFLTFNKCLFRRDGILLYFKNRSGHSGFLSHSCLLPPSVHLHPPSKESTPESICICWSHIYHVHLMTRYVHNFLSGDPCDQHPTYSCSYYEMRRWRKKPIKMTFWKMSEATSIFICQSPSNGVFMTYYTLYTWPPSFRALALDNTHSTKLHLNHFHRLLPSFTHSIFFQHICSSVCRTKRPVCILHTFNPTKRAEESQKMPCPPPLRNRWTEKIALKSIRCDSSSRLQPFPLTLVHRTSPHISIHL